MLDIKIKNCREIYFKLKRENKQMHISFLLLIERKINKHSFKDKLKIENKQISFTTSNLHPSYKKIKNKKPKIPKLNP